MLAVFTSPAALEPEVAAALVDALAEVLADALAEALAEELAEELADALEAALLDDDEPPQAAKPSMATRAALAASAKIFVLLLFIMFPFDRSLPSLR